MGHQRHKKILKRIIASLILASFFCAGTAFAQEAAPAEESAPAATGPCAETAEPPECLSVSCPSPESESPYILSTVIEEGFGTDTPAGETPDTVVKTCIRQTTIDEESSTSVYVEPGECTPSGSGTKVICQRVQIIFTKSGSALLFGYIAMIYRWAAGVIGIVSVLFLVWGGIEIASAGDDTSKIDAAKKRITQSITGLVLLFMSAIILYTINPNFFTL